MSITGAMNTAVYAVAAQSQAMNSISNNIANVNTTGYKRSETMFSTLVTSSDKYSGKDPGIGTVRASNRTLIDQQGQFEQTSSMTDLAISGNGFFVTTRDSAPAASSERLFTRVGSFNPDQFGNLQNSAGLYLQGLELTPYQRSQIQAGNYDQLGSPQMTGLKTVNVNAMTSTAVATDRITLAANLPADDVSAAANTAGSTRHIISMPIIDSVGQSYTLNMVAQKTAAGTWAASAGAPPVVGPPAQPAIDGLVDKDGNAVAATFAGLPPSIVFNSDGTLNTPATLPQLTITSTALPNGAVFKPITIDMGTGGAPGTGQANGLAQYSSTFNVMKTDQNGVTAGSLSGVDISKEGIVRALFSNGQQVPIFILPLARFGNENGLASEDGTSFRATAGSGLPLLKQPLLAGDGTGGLQSQALETSTVDLATEFTTMIRTQRAYSANAKTITTADEMLQEILSIRR
jgi:flagellar hook protein FlgE